MVPPRGFEPLISTLKGWRPRPLDDGGTLARRWPSLAEGPPTASSEGVALGPYGPLATWNRMIAPAAKPGRGHRRSAADERDEHRPAVPPVLTRPQDRAEAVRGQRSEHDRQHDRAGGQQRDL